MQPPSSIAVLKSSVGNIFAQCLAERGDGNLFSNKPNSVNLFACPKVEEKCTSGPTFEAKVETEDICDEQSELTSGSLPDTLQSIPAVKCQKVGVGASKDSLKQDRTYLKLLSIRAKKFRAGDRPLLNDVDVSVEKPLDSKGWLTLVVRDQRTKRLLYQAVLLPVKAEINEFMQKPENIRMNVWKTPNDPSNFLHHFVKQMVKMQLEDHRDAERLKKVIEKWSHHAETDKNNKETVAQPVESKQNLPPKLIVGLSQPQPAGVQNSLDDQQEDSINSNIMSPSESECPQSEYPTITIIPPPEDFPICRT